MNYKIKALDYSRNSKLGGMPATWSDIDTCPDSCKLKLPAPGRKRAPCYFWGGFRTAPLGEKLNKGETTYYNHKQFLSWIGTLSPAQLWRDRVGGDQIPTEPGGDTIDRKAFDQVTRANQRAKARGFGFTHYPMDDHNADAVESGYHRGYVLNASADHVHQAVELKKARPGLSVVTVARKNYDTKSQHIGGVHLVQCPNTWDKKITCKRCQLCAMPARPFVIVFPATGNGGADIIARGE